MATTTSYMLNKGNNNIVIIPLLNTIYNILIFIFNIYLYMYNVILRRVNLVTIKNVIYNNGHYLVSCISLRHTYK